MMLEMGGSYCENSVVIFLEVRKEMSPSFWWRIRMSFSFPRFVFGSQLLSVWSLSPARNKIAIREYIRLFAFLREAPFVVSHFSATLCFFFVLFPDGFVVPDERMACKTEKKCHYGMGLCSVSDNAHVPYWCVPASPSSSEPDWVPLSLEQNITCLVEYPCLNYSAFKSGRT